MTKARDPVSNSVERYRDAVVNRLLVGCCTIACLGVPASLSRIPTTGWLPLYGFHALLGAIAIGTYMARERLSANVKTGIIVTLFYGVGIVGIVNLGLLGAGVWWLVVSSLLLGVMYSPRVGLYATILSFAFVGLVGYGFVQGYLLLAIDANDYLASAASWATLIIATSVMPFFVFQAIATLQVETESLVEEVQRQRDEITRLASHDQLTGLLMPRALEERIDHAIQLSHRHGRRLALMFLDLDRFKAVNDTYGHAAGDHVLQTMGQRFSEVLRVSDSKGRIGGDEFVFLLEQPGTDEQIAAIAQRLVETACAPVPFGDFTLQVGASVGVALCPEDGGSSQSLRQAADRAMYEAKAAGRGVYCFASGEVFAAEVQGPVRLVSESR